MPYVTVGTNYQGGVCWLVIDRDIVIECTNGARAVAVMEHLLITKHR